MEPQIYESSPFATYLKEVEIPELPTTDLSTPPLPDAHSPRSHRRGDRDEIESLKYLIATSSLLSPSLYDALQLYPPLLNNESNDTKGKRRMKTQEEEGGSNLVTWPREWETFGQDWRDRQLLDNASRALKGLVQTVKSLTLKAQPATQQSVLVNQSVLRVNSTAEESSSSRDGEGMIKEVRDFIEKAQQLDRKIQQVLNQIEQTSNIFSTSSSFQTPPETPTCPRNSKPPPSLETLLSQELKSLVKLYQTYTIRLSTLLPLSALPQALQMPQGSASTSNPAASPSSSPLIPTRLGTQRTNNHQATASLSELHRHASLAILERKEIQQWESSNSFSPSSPSTSFSPTTTKPRPSSVYSSTSTSDSTLLNQSIASEDPFHPTETFFGGLERKSSTRSNPSYHLTSSSSLTTSSASNERGQHRFRPSIGNQGVFGIGTSAASGGGGGVSPLLREISSKRDSRKRRPVSMGGWIESTSSRSSVPLIPLSPTVVVVTEGSSSSSRFEEEDQKKRRVEGNLQGEWDVEEKIMEGLRKDWENSHLFRKGFIWNLIALFEEVGEEEEEEGEEGEKVTRNNHKWEETRKVLKELVSSLQGVLERIDLVRLEVQTNQTTILDRQRPQRQDHHSPRLSSSSIVVTPFSPSPSPLPHLLRLSSPPSTSSNSFTSSPFSRPLVQPNFAPPRDSSSLPTIQALNSYQLSHNSLSNSLGSMQSLLDSIVSELRTLSPTSPPPPTTLASTTTEDDETEQHRQQQHRQGRIEGLLKKHDQIKEELQSFAIEWSKSRVSIRQAVGVELKTSTVEQQQQSSTKVREREGEGIEKEEKTELNPEDAPPEEVKELENALLDDGQNLSPNDDDDFSSRQAVIDAILSTSLDLGNGLGIATEGEGGEEKIFEAVVGGEEKEKRGQGGEKLSREERVKRMKEAREALKVGKQATGEGGVGGGFEAQQKMVGELREVLKGLGKGRD